MSFVLTFAMALGSIPTDGIAYAAITNGVKTSQTETKVETTETPATTPTVGVAVDANVSTTDEAKPKTVTVRFDANGGEGRMDDFEVTLDNSDWSVAETPFTRDGYRFVGWSIASDVAKDAVDDPETDIDESLMGVVLADRQEFVDLVSQRRDDGGNVVETHDFGKYVSDDVLTLYAQWEKVETAEVSAPVVEENEVVGNDEVVEDTSVGKDDVIDARSDKELDQELLSGVFGGKTDGGVADKIGTSNPLLRKLTAPLMAAAAPSLKAQSTPDGSREGTAYAVLDSAGTLTLFRSNDTYTAGTGQTVTDIMGNTYTGQVYTGVENTGAKYNSAPWYRQLSRVKLARIADGQVIAPKSCVGWFYDCSNMTAFEGAERLDTSAVTYMYCMFYGCSAMTEPPAVGNWDTSAVATMGGMFYNCSSMTEPPSVGNWDTSTVTSMFGMFYNCSSMTEPPTVGSWDTSAVTYMRSMFYNCSSMTVPPEVGNWDTSKVTDTGYMFSNCSAMTTPPAVGNWDTSAVTYMRDMFRNCSKMPSLDVSGWDFSKVTESSNYLGLQNCPALRELKVPAGAKITGLPEHSAQGAYLATWGNAGRNITGSTAANLMSVVNAGNGAGTWKWELDPRSGTAYAVLDSAGTLTFFRSTNTYTAGTGQTVTDIMGNTYTGQVYTGVENTGANYNSAPWYSQRSSVKLARIADGQVIAPKSCAGWFYQCSNMTAFEGADRLDTSAVTSMYYMFVGCSAMTVPPEVGNWNTSAVTDMGSIFYNCSSMTVPPSVGSWRTSKVTNMSSMFGKCSAMTEPPAVGSWDTSAVTGKFGMSSMFRDCSSMTVPPAVGSWNTSAVTDMGGMFFGCSSMTEPPSVGSWRTSAVTNMNGMFGGCKAMTEPPAVGNWDTSAVTNMGSMFRDCSAMTVPPAVGNWDTSAVTNMDNMFNNCSKMPSLDVSGWDFSKVTESSNYLGLQNCSALRELKVPAGAKITGLPEHSAQGDYAATWGNVDRGVTGATAAALVQAVNAGNGAGTWTWDKAAAEWQDPGQDITVDTDNTDHDNGTYLVTIPTKIAYENMNIGKVSTSDDYTVNVRGAIKDGQTVTITAETQNKLKNGSFEDITETTTQGKTAWTSAEVFNKLNADGSVAGTDTTDTIKMSGEVKSAGKYEGVVGYSAKLS